MKYKLITLCPLLILVFAFLVPNNTHSYNPLGQACKNAGQKGPICEQNNKQQNAADNTNPVVRQIQTIANFIALIAGILSVLTIIYGGFLFVTSGGNTAGGQRAGDPQGRAKQGRAAITGAVAGLIIIALAWTLITFITTSILD